MSKCKDSDILSMDTLSFKELKSLIIKDFGPNAADDHRISRFLKAKDSDVKQAYTMIKKDLEWRKNNSIDSLLQNYKETEFYTKYFPARIIGFDKENSPLIVINFGKADLKGFVKSSKKEDVLRHMTYVLELCEEMMRRRSEEVSRKFDGRWTMIVDMEDISYFQFSSKLVVEMAIEACLLHDAHFPERLKAAHIINSSTPVQVLYSIVKPFMALNTQQKVKFYGKDGWKEELLKLIDSKVLPAFLGGERTDPDGNIMCNTFVCHGGLIPERFYMKNSRKSLKNQAGVRSHVLKRRSTLRVPLCVQKEGSFIEWEFETDDHDIGFGLFFRDFDSNEEDEMLPLIPTERVDSYLLCETGTFKCENSGIYILILDNSYSRLRSKNVYYKVSVVKPGDKKNVASKKI